MIWCILGCLLVMLPFVVILSFACKVLGWKFMFAVVGVAGGFIGSILLGMYMLSQYCGGC